PTRCPSRSLHDALPISDASTHGGEEMLLLARIVRIATTVVVGFIVVGIAMHLLDAHASNAVVGFVYDVAGWFVAPFRGVFSPGGDRKSTRLNSSHEWSS